MNATLTPKLVYQVGLFQAHCGIRHYLNGIHVRPHPAGALIAATDGHRMLLAVDEHGTCDEPMTIRLPRAAMTAARAAVRAKRDMDLRVIVDGQRLSINAHGAAPHSQTETYVLPGPAQIDGSWPWKAVRRLLPDFGALVQGSPPKEGFNPAVLSVLDDVRLCGKLDRTAGPVVFWHGADKTTTYVQLLEHPELLGIVMPMRTSADDRELFGRTIANITKNTDGNS